MKNPSLKNSENGVVSSFGNTTKKNIFYGRCSTMKQKNSIETQLEMVRKYCDLHNIELDEIIIDEGKSGKNQKRDGITKVMDLIKQNKVDNLIVLSLSRFGRSFIENYKSVEIMKKHKTNFISLKENLNLKDSMGVFIFQIFSSIYELEISNLSERTSDTLQSKKYNGKVYSGSIMYGFDRSAGAVASIKKIKNPIKLARKVLEETEHVLLVGEGAESFAESIGEAIVEPSYFHSEKNLKRLRKLKSKIADSDSIQDKIGTVGAVAIDKKGNISAATSTGGMTNKMPGRVGDTPIIGSGTWAQNQVCGVSSTGHGEFFIKFQVAKEVCARMEYLNQSLEDSSNAVIKELKGIGASGGLIAIDKDANVSMPFNTEGMIRGSLTNVSALNVSIY
mgnify:CR=1 FL=1